MAAALHRPFRAGDVSRQRAFHLERLSMVLLAIGGLVLLSFGDLGSECSDIGEEVRCRIGNTDVTDRELLLLTFTPLVFGPLVYLIAAVTPRWREPLGLGAQIFVVVTGLSIVAAGFMLMGWGSSTGAIIALAVGGAGIYMAFRSWRARQEPDPTPAAGTGSG